MARIDTYDADAAIVGDEKLVGSDSDDSTKNYPINSLALALGLGGAANNPVTLTSVAGDVDWSGLEGTIYELALTENTTLNFPSAPTDNKILRIKVTQTTPYNFTLSYNGNYKFPSGVAPTMTAGGSPTAYDVYTFLVDGTDLVMINAAQELNYPVV